MCKHCRRLRQKDVLFEIQLERLSLTGKKTASEIADELQAFLFLGVLKAKEDICCQETHRGCEGRIDGVS